MDLLWQFSIIQFLLSISPVYTTTSICNRGILKQAWVTAFYSQRSWKPCSLQLLGVMEQAAQANLCSSWLLCSTSSVKFCRLSPVTSLPTKIFSSTCINLFKMCFLSLLLAFVKDEWYGMYQRSKLLLPTDCATKPDSATSYPFAVYCRQVGIFSHIGKLVGMHIAWSRFFTLL